MKTQKGITLIALIITIVVLLILAVVAISSITNDGVLHYAQNAADSWNKAQENETAMLQNYLEYLDKYAQGGTTTAPGAPTAIEGVSVSGTTLSVVAEGGNGIGYQYKVGESGTWSSTVTTGTGYGVDVSTGTSWTIYARTVDANGNTSAMSTELKIILATIDSKIKFYVRESMTWQQVINDGYAEQDFTNFGIERTEIYNIAQDEWGYWVVLHYDHNGDGSQLTVVDPSDSINAGNYKWVWD